MLACGAEVAFRPTCQRYVKGEHLAVATGPPATKHSEHLKVSYSGRQLEITVEQYKRSRFRKAALSSSCRGAFCPIVPRKQSHRSSSGISSIFIECASHRGISCAYDDSAACRWPRRFDIKASAARSFCNRSRGLTRVCFHFRALSWALCSRAARTNGDNCDRSTHCFINSCCKFVRIALSQVFCILHSPSTSHGHWLASPDRL